MEIFVVLICKPLYVTNFTKKSLQTNESPLYICYVTFSYHLIYCDITWCLLFQQVTIYLIDSRENIVLIVMISRSYCTYT